MLRAVAAIVTERAPAPVRTVIVPFSATLVPSWYGNEPAWLNVNE